LLLFQKNVSLLSKCPKNSYNLLIQLFISNIAQNTVIFPARIEHNGKPQRLWSLLKVAALVFALFFSPHLSKGWLVLKTYFNEFLFPKFLNLSQKSKRNKSSKTVMLKCQNFVEANIKVDMQGSKGLAWLYTFFNPTSLYFYPWPFW